MQHSHTQSNSSNQLKKPLNRAFLRAYSQEQPTSSVVPAPHARRSADGPAAEQADPGRQPLAAERRALAHDRDLHLELPTAASGGSAQESTIPAPHVQFPTTIAVTTQQWDAQASWVNQFDATPVMNDPPPAPVAPPAKANVQRPPLSPPRPQPSAAPAPHLQNAASERRFTVHQPHPVQPAIDSQEGEAEPNEFLPAWEVDRFGWTPECERLFQQLASAFDDAGEQLRTVSEEGLHVLAVSSVYRGEGRTLVASLLARAAARAGLSVALFDADIDNPQMAAQLKVQLNADWLNTLHEGLPLEEAAVASIDEHIIAYPLRTDAREQMVLLNHPNVVRLLRRISETVDLVIVDLGPYTHDERRMFPAGIDCPVDAAIVVRDLRSTNDQQARTIAQALRGMGVEAVGIAENFARD